VRERFKGEQSTRFLATIGWLVIIVAGMRAGESILIPLLLSAFLAIICAPPVLWLERKGLHVALAVPIVMLGVVLIGVGFGALAGTSLTQFTQALPRYQAQLQQEMMAFLRWLQGFGLQLSPDDIVAFIDPGAAMRLGARLLTGLGELLTNTFLILLTVMFILFEASSLPTKVKAIWGDPAVSLTSLTKVLQNVNQFLAIKTLVSLGTGVTVAVWVAVLGIDFPFLWGLLAFVLNYIPNLGSIIAGAPAVLLGFIQFGLGRALVAALGYVVINLVFGTLLEPKLLGRRLGLSTLAVFLSLVFWGWVWGPVGMVLSVPLTMIMKIALESNDSTRWLAVLIDSRVREETPVSTVPSDSVEVKVSS